MRSARQWCGWGALLVTLSSCLGGQTGQPTAAGCEGRVLAPDEPVSGVTAAQLLATFGGTHRATLEWLTPEPVPEDELTLELHADESNATLPCGIHEMHIPVDVVFGTRDHGELEHFDGTLVVNTRQATRAEISRVGSRVALDVELVVVEGQVRISGEVTTTDEALPADHAVFPAPAGGAGGGGQ